MSTIVTRAGKGSALTNTEVDSNFTNLNTDKIQVTGTPTNGQAVTWNGTAWVPSTIVTGGGPITQNQTTITSNQTIASGSNGLSVGPMTVNTGVSVTVATGSKWVILNY